jgi:hypothetical protein
MEHGDPGRCPGLSYVAPLGLKMVALLLPDGIARLGEEDKVRVNCRIGDATIDEVIPFKQPSSSSCLPIVATV